MGNWIKTQIGRGVGVVFRVSYCKEFVRFNAVLCLLSGIVEATHIYEYIADKLSKESPLLLNVILYFMCSAALNLQSIACTSSLQYSEIIR
jgi:hypothetical protein